VQKTVETANKYLSSIHHCILIYFTLLLCIG